MTSTKPFLTTIKTYKFNSFAELLHKVLAIKNISQENLAIMVDKDPAQVSKWVTGAINKPSANTVFVISAALDVQITRLKEGYELTIEAHDDDVDKQLEAVAKTGRVDLSDDLTSAQIRDKLWNYLQKRMQRLSKQIASYSQEMQEIRQMHDLLDLYKK